MANDYTPQQIEQFLQEFFDVVGTRQYIGARYVPVFGHGGNSPIEWDGGAEAYEPLSIVYHVGTTYTSRQYVPAGVDIANTDYWVVTANYNAQVEQYRQEVLGFDSRINATEETVEEFGNSLPSSAFSEQNTVKDYIDSSIDAIDEFVPFPTSPLSQYGSLGEVLSTLGDGSTEWIPAVAPTDAQAEEYISAWLTAHPEATTTVADGSITLAKLAQTLINDILKLSKASCTTLDNTADIDSLSNGNYLVPNAATATALNLPVAGGGRLWHFDLQANNRYFQLYLSGMDLYVRNYNGTTWASWSQLLYARDTVNIVKDSFAALVASVDTPINTSGADLNSYITAGNYHCSSSTTSQTLLHNPTTASFKLYVIETITSNRLYQIIISNTDDNEIYVRFYNGSWTEWTRIAYQHKTITNTNIIVSSSTELDDFDNAPVNTIIATNRPNIPNGPTGDNYLINIDSQPGRLRGTLITYSPQDHGYTYKCQLFIGYYASIADNSPIISYRFAISSGGTWTWSPWAKFSQDRFLGATNIVIRASTASLWFTDLNDVPPNTIYQIDKDCIEGTLANHPAAGYSCVLNTYAFSVSTRHGMVQELWSLQNGRCVKYFRYGWLNDVDDYRWTNWERVTTTEVV